MQLALGLAVPLLLAVLPIYRTAIWQGSATVEFRLLVLDAETGKPLPDFKVLLVQSENWASPEEFSTAGDGSLSIIKRCTTTGRSSLFRKTRSVSVGRWSFRVEAPGYELSGPICPDDHRSEIEEDGNGYVLPIRVELKPVAGRADAP